jgi:uncharacterized XkdX family phage protein
MAIIWYDLVKLNFDSGNYSVEDCRVFVVKGKITAQEFADITGVAYAV